MEKEIVEEFSKDELSILKLLCIMQEEKDPKKWHENIFCSKRCKKSQNLEEGSSKSSKLEDGRVLETHQEDHLVVEISSSKVCVSSQEHVIDNDGDNPSYLLPMGNIREYMREYGEPLQKQLTISDVNVNQNRLLLNKKHVEKSFLPFLRNDENIEKGIQVCAYDIHENSYTLTFKKWTNKYYVLNGGWKDFFQVHKLHKNDIIIVWIFRHSSHSKLCFAFDYKKIGR